MKNFTIKRLVDADPELAHKLKLYCYDLNGCCQMVHQELGPFLNEYMYQDALQIVLEEQHINHQKEYYFSIDFHGKKIQHKHYVDFFCRDNVYIECKAVETLLPNHRQQLWNYMRLTNVQIGILWNFAPVHDQCEHYYLDTATQQMYAF